MSTITIGNRRRPNISLRGGTGQAVRVVSSIGLSPEAASIEDELQKALAAISAGADIVNDDSIVEPEGTDLVKRLLEACSVPINTEPVFDTVASFDRMGASFSFTEADILETVRKHAELGVDIVTLHVAFCRELAHSVSKSTRVMKSVSRGGTLLGRYMGKHGQENPYRTGFDGILEVLSDYRVVLSLGTVLRPGCIADANDECYQAELREQSVFVERALQRGVQVMVEGPGHVRIDHIGSCIQQMKQVTGGVPIRMLGPTVCDCAAGYDHISGSIGAAVAAMCGCDFLTCTPRSEHIGLPTKELIREAVIAYRIAAYAKANGNYDMFARDLRVSLARAAGDWGGMFRESLYGSDAECLHRSLNEQGSRHCSLCGKYCPLLTDWRRLQGDHGAKRQDAEPARERRR